MRPVWNQLEDPGSSKVSAQKWSKLMSDDTYTGWSKKQRSSAKISWAEDVLIRYYYNMRSVIEGYETVGDGGPATDHGSVL